ncbi:hypothetical protein BDV26DRAFT_126239 [Aspergillus bertholletiae]|uniref:Uncharacterized protein n=1 Tax=Aspergillus bertholletiae TaxID=1226010 RepID=A0A5N7ANS2_9EURO|nr:hypothetical protein BDV26DRAFT_126239 [Aspergillus bertholletiae]
MTAEGEFLLVNEASKVLGLVPGTGPNQFPIVCNSAGLFLEDSTATSRFVWFLRWLKPIAILPIGSAIYFAPLELSKGIMCWPMRFRVFSVCLKKGDMLPLNASSRVGFFFHHL